ncbi:MAG: APC family permease [Alicyclobacillaceae bacterium]|nr:APC family permease [Alicyclobacillaceae bacterium]
MVESVKRLIVGRPLKTKEHQNVRIGIIKGMAVMTPDALSSVAYATDQMEFVLSVLIGAGATASYVSNVLGFSLLGTAIICGLAFLLFLAYRNIIRHYPAGGGAYAIGLHDLGRYWGLSAASTLIVGYTLTVSVSIAAGIDALGPVIPFIGHHKLWFNILLTLIIMVINLRGTGESAAVFVPFTYCFIAGILLLGITAIVDALRHPWAIHLPSASGMRAVQGMSLFLFLRMFANGCSALTGIEAVANSVPVFKEPATKRAQRLLLMLVITLSVLFFIVSGVALMHGLRYNPDVPLINQESMVVFGTRGFGYVLTVLVSLSTTCILAVAANTAFTGCPALWSSMARDGYMPRWILHKGDRLVYSNGIVFLTIISLLLTIGFDAKVSRLIPLYGVCVFYTFTISQLGMVVRQIRERGKNWLPSVIGGSFGVMLTFAACVIFGVTHFLDGAWLVLVCIPLMVIGFGKIKTHYDQVRTDLKYDFSVPFHPEDPGLTIVPIASVNKASVRALQFAVSNFKNVIAVTVVTGDSEEEMKRATEKVEADFARLQSGVRLVVIHSQYRNVAKRLQRFVEFETEKYESDNITVVIPQFFTRRWWHKLLHNKTGGYLMAWLLLNKNVKVITVPYRLPR